MFQYLQSMRTQSFEKCAHLSTSHCPEKDTHHIQGETSQQDQILFCETVQNKKKRCEFNKLFHKSLASIAATMREPLSNLTFHA
jgi:hypothetical protein